MIHIKRFDHGGAAQILQRKGLLAEIDSILNQIVSVEKRQIHDIISGYLANKGWKIKTNLLIGTDYQQDAYKDKIMVEIDFSIIDSVHRNFIRAQELFNRKVIDAFVQIVPIEREPRFDKMRRDIQLFSSCLTVPVYLIGLS